MSVKVQMLKTLNAKECLDDIKTLNNKNIKLIVLVCLFNFLFFIIFTKRTTKMQKEMGTEELRFECFDDTASI